MALIEARSCERMTLLADALTDASLAALYRSLLAGEARHHRAYVDLACGVAPRARVRQRLTASHLVERRGHHRPLLLPGRPAAGGGQRAAAQPVQKRAVARQQVQRPADAAGVVPLHHESVLAVLDVLLVTGDGGHDAGRGHVEALQRRPEHALDPVYAQKLGVKTDELLISQPDTGEQALEIAETLVRSGAIDVIVVDSVAALVPKAEIDGEMGDAQMGLQARLMSQALRKLTGIISKSKTAMIFINQLRQKIGMFVGNPETTTGGNALKFYASVRLDVRRIGQIKEGDETTGSRVRVKVVKNKVAPPFRQAEFDMMYGEGISREGDLLDLASDRGLVHKSGAWYAYQDERIGQGRENAKKYLKEHPDITAAIEQQLRQTLGLTRVAAEPRAGDGPNGGSLDLQSDEV